MLRRLAVFPSDFGLDAVEAVATGEGIARKVGARTSGRAWSRSPSWPD